MFYKNKNNVRFLPSKGDRDFYLKYLVDADFFTSFS